MRRAELQCCAHTRLTYPDPIIKELERDGSASCFFVQGKVITHPPAGFSEYFGPGPHWRFLDDQGTAEQAMLQRIRQFPDAMTAEDTLRKLIPTGASRNDNIAALRLVQSLAPIPLILCKQLSLRCLPEDSSSQLSQSRSAASVKDVTLIL